MLSFTRHSSKNLKMSEIVFWIKFFFLPALTVQQGQGPISISFIHSGIIGVPIRFAPAGQKQRVDPGERTATGFITIVLFSITSNDKYVFFDDPI
jgi:hypothetical protein